MQQRALTQPGLFNISAGMNGAAFLRGLAQGIRTVLADNGMPLARPSQGSVASFDATCEPTLATASVASTASSTVSTKPRHPRTGGQAMRMKRTIGEATIKAVRHPDLDGPGAQVLASVRACIFVKHLRRPR